MKSLTLTFAVLLSAVTADAYEMYLVSTGVDSFHFEAYPKRGSTPNNFTWNSGLYDDPVFWDGDPQLFRRGTPTSDVSTSAQDNAIQAALDEWDDVDTGSFSVSWGGSSPSLQNDVDDGNNAIFFATFSELGAAPGKTLITYVTTAGVDHGEITDTDIVLNDGADWSTSTMLCPADTTATKDIQSVVTHELGHALGFNHTGTSPACSSMPTLWSGGTGCGTCEAEVESEELRSLEQDDLNGYDEVYGSGNAGGSDGVSVLSDQGGDSAKRAGSALAPATVDVLTMYPNPFNPETTIEFRLTRPQIVSLVVYNSAGQIVQRLVDHRRYFAGTHAIKWDAASGEMASGTYVVKLITGQDVVHRKVTLVR